MESRINRLIEVFFVGIVLGFVAGLALAWAATPKKTERWFVLRGYERIGPFDSRDECVEWINRNATKIEPGQ